MRFELDQEDFGTLCICAIRYCQGRKTYMPSLVRTIIRPYMSKLSDKDLSVMIQDCKFQSNMELWGDEIIDKPGWINWKKELEMEKVIREHRINNKFLDAEKLEKEGWTLQRTSNTINSNTIEIKKPTQINQDNDVITVNSFIEAINSYIQEEAKFNTDANFLAGLETAGIIAQKLAGTFEDEVEDE